MNRGLFLEIRKIKTNLKKLEIDTYSLIVHSYGNRDILKDDKTNYKVFTPYFRRGCLNATEPRRPFEKPKIIDYVEVKNFKSLKIDELNLLPRHNWKNKIIESWSIGEKAATTRLNQFINNELDRYKEGRNFPNKKNVSRLSQHLHLCEISPNTVWHAVKDLNQMGLKHQQDTDVFLSEMDGENFQIIYCIITRITKKNLQTKFDNFPWIDNSEHLLAWKTGQTGYPIVDAGMRELWSTGYMHNRLRMIVGSFLVKNLLTHWHEGKDGFGIV